MWNPEASWLEHQLHHALPPSATVHAGTDAGVLVEIGPDAHSTQGLDNVDYGIGIARKGWLGAADVLNTRDAAAVCAHAKARRQGRLGSGAPHARPVARVPMEDC